MRLAAQDDRGVPRLLYLAAVPTTAFSGGFACPPESAGGHLSRSNSVLTVVASRFIALFAQPLLAWRQRSPPEAPDRGGCASGRDGSGESATGPGRRDANGLWDRRERRDPLVRG